ncbi:MAG: DUF3368 domain-containing protein [Bacteroidetes bacterium]|nr:DUF3368 domain-containing protein [Bacteroidota bacterium]
MSRRVPFPCLIPDSSCLITLERIGQLTLLPAVADDVIAPPAVINEVGIVPNWVKPRAVQNEALFRSLHPPLGAGEAEVLALGLDIDDARVVIDERRARQIARRLEIPLVGTLGLLLVAKREGALGAVEPVLRALEAAGFHMSEALRSRVLRQAGERENEA